MEDDIFGSFLRCPFYLAMTAPGRVELDQSWLRSNNLHHESEAKSVNNSKKTHTQEGVVDIHCSRATHGIERLRGKSMDTVCNNTGGQGQQNGDAAEEKALSVDHCNEIGEYRGGYVMIAES